MHFGLPALGFNGAAIASIFAEASGMLVVFVVIHAQGISKELQLYSHWAFDKAKVRLILTQSSPLVFQFVISITAWVFFYILVEHHGRQALAISNTMRNIFGLFGVFTWAFASATNAMVSNIIGQGMQDKVTELIRKIVKLSLSFSVIVALLLNCFPALFLSVYGQDPAFTQAAIPVIRIVSTALILMSFSTIWLNAVTGTGNTRINLLIELITIIFYCAYVYLTLERWNMSLVVGWICFKFRLREFYFAVVTLAFAELARLVILNWQSVTNGTLGLLVLDKVTVWVPGAGIVAIDGTIRWYVLALTCLLIVAFLSAILVRSWIGRNFSAIRLNEDLAQTLGISTFRYKLLAFMISNVLAAFGSGMPRRASGLLNLVNRANSFLLPAVTAAAKSFAKSQKNRNGLCAPNSSPINSSGGAGASRSIATAARTARASAIVRILSPKARLPIWS